MGLTGEDESGGLDGEGFERIEQGLGLRLPKLWRETSSIGGQ